MSFSPFQFETLSTEFQSIFGFVGVSLLFLSLVVFAVHVVLARDDPDAGGDRDRMLHSGFVMVVALAVLLFTGFRSLEAAVHAFIFDEDEVVDGMSFGGFPGEGSRHALTSLAVALGLVAVAVAAFVVYLLYRRWLEPTRERVHEGRGPLRTYRAYLSGVAFLTIVTALFAAAILAYDIFRAIAPEVTSTVLSEDAERNAAIARLVAALALVLASVTIFRMHREETEVLREADLSVWSRESEAELDAE